MRYYLSGLLLLAAACQDAGAPQLQLRPNLEIVAGDGQTDTVTRLLPTPILVRVRDSATTRPAPGVLVNWVIVQGGGSVFAGAALTNDSGLAQERWTLGPTAGTQILEARAVDPNTGQPIVYERVTATAVPGPLAYAGFLTTRARVLGETPVALQATATDAHGNRLPLPTVQSLDGLGFRISNDTVHVTTDQPGQFRFVLDDDTARVFVHMPAGAWWHQQSSADTAWVQSGQFMFVGFRLATNSVNPADTTADYEIVPYKSVKYIQGVPVDSADRIGLSGFHVFTNTVGSSQLGPTGMALRLDYAYEKAPAMTFATTWALFVGKQGNAWEITNGAPCGAGCADTVQIR